MDSSQILDDLGRLLIPGRLAAGLGRPLTAVLPDVWLYILLLLFMILIFQQPEGSLFPLLFLAGGVLCIFLDKAMVFYGGGWGHLCSMGALLVRLGMFATPFLAVGLSKNAKSRPLGIITGLLAGVYLFTLWFTEMRTCGFGGVV